MKGHRPRIQYKNEGFLRCFYEIYCAHNNKTAFYHKKINLKKKRVQITLWSLLKEQVMAQIAATMK